MLLTDRRRLFGRREEDDERDPHQGSLFAPDGLAAPAARSPGVTPDPFAPLPPRAEVEAPAAGLAAPPAEIPDTGLVPAEDDADETMVVAADDLAELEPVHVRVAASRSVLAGPTLDDVMSRVWEGLRAEVPTPCPVCHTEIEPSAHGRCGACGSILD